MDSLFISLNPAVDSQNIAQPLTINLGNNASSIAKYYTQKGSNEEWFSLRDYIDNKSFFIKKTNVEDYFKGLPTTLEFMTLQKKLPTLFASDPAYSSFGMLKPAGISATANLRNQLDKTKNAGWEKSWEVSLGAIANLPKPSKGSNGGLRHRFNCLNALASDRQIKIRIHRLWHHTKYDAAWTAAIATKKVEDNWKDKNIDVQVVKIIPSPTSYVCVGVSILGFYNTYMDRESLTEMNKAYKEKHTAQGALDTAPDSFWLRWPDTELMASKADPSTIAAEKAAGQANVDKAAVSKLNKQGGRGAGNSPSLDLVAITANANGFKKMKTDSGAKLANLDGDEDEYIRQTYWESNMATQDRKDTGPRDQNKVMGASAAEVAAAYLTPSKAVPVNVVEWLHKSGHAYGAIESGKYSIEPQTKANLMLGTWEANTIMLRDETVLQKLARYEWVLACYLQGLGLQKSMFSTVRKLPGLNETTFTKYDKNQAVATAEKWRALNWPGQPKLKLTVTNREDVDGVERMAVTGPTDTTGNTGWWNTSDRSPWFTPYLRYDVQLLNTSIVQPRIYSTNYDAYNLHRPLWLETQLDVVLVACLAKAQAAALCGGNFNSDNWEAALVAAKLF